MRSREGLRGVTAAGLTSMLLLAGMARAEPGAAPQEPDVQAVRAAASAVERDPLLPGIETYKTLRFGKEDPKDSKKQKPQDPDIGWWTNLMENLSGGLRVAIWLFGAGMLVWALLRLRDWLLQREGGAPMQRLAPTHVGELDIRPESLPPEVGAAAQALWQRGELRAALSLLYRGALSRLVHGHGVAIRAASTEGECLRLAAAHLAPEALGFLKQLVGGWQAVAYAQRELPADAMAQLCAEFDRYLPEARVVARAAA